MVFMSPVGDVEGGRDSLEEKEEEVMLLALMSSSPFVVLLLLLLLLFSLEGRESLNILARALAYSVSLSSKVLSLNAFSPEPPEEEELCRPLVLGALLIIFTAFCGGAEILLLLISFLIRN